MTETSS